MTLKATIYCAFMLVCMYSSGKRRSMDMSLNLNTLYHVKYCRCLNIFCYFSAASVNETVFENEVAKLWCDIGVSDPRLITTWSWSNGTLIATYLMGTGFTPTDEGAMLEPYVDSTGILYINNTDSQFNGEVFRCDGFAESGAPGKECNVTLNIIGKCVSL